MRKSPIKHHVSKYKRHNGTPVTDYMRGFGEHPPKLANPRLKNQDKRELEKYQILIKYDNIENVPTESFTIKALNYPTAIDYGLLSRRHITPPYEVEVTKLV